MRALLCHCRRHLQTQDDEALRAVVREHLTHEHPALEPSDEQVEEIFTTRAYDLVYVGPFVDGQEESVFDPFN
jgi:hypothetical protein